MSLVVVSVGRVKVISRGYLKHAFARVREQGGLCVSDEVQTGFGRTGEHFWGFEVNVLSESTLLTSFLTCLPF